MPVRVVHRLQGASVESAGDRLARQAGDLRSLIEREQAGFLGESRFGVGSEVCHGQTFDQATRTPAGVPWQGRGSFLWSGATSVVVVGGGRRR